MLGCLQHAIGLTLAEESRPVLSGRVCSVGWNKGTLRSMALAPTTHVTILACIYEPAWPVLPRVVGHTTSGPAALHADACWLRRREHNLQSDSALHGPLLPVRNHAIGTIVNPSHAAAASRPETDGWREDWWKRLTTSRSIISRSVPSI